MHNPEARFLPVPMRVETAQDGLPRSGEQWRVIAHGGLLIDCAHEVGAKAVIRGLRPLGDLKANIRWRR